MRYVFVVGESGNRYLAYETGETWNGVAVLGFTWTELSAMVRLGDGADGNGEGIRSVGAYGFVDITSGESAPVPSDWYPILSGTSVRLYVPEGRIWEVSE